MDVRHFLITTLFALWSCSSESSTKQQTGVTSTGNAGDVAGYVVVQLDASRQAEPVDSALIVLRDSSGLVVDSVRTNLDGAFRIRTVRDGTLQLSAELAGMRTVLDMDLKSGIQQVYRVVLGGAAALLQDTLPVSLYSSRPGRVYQPFYGEYSFKASEHSLHFVREWEGEPVLQADWTLNWGDLEMILFNSSQSACTTKPTFISFSPQVLEGNRWIYNGDLSGDFDGQTACSEALRGLPEMSGLAFTGLEIQFQQEGFVGGYFFAPGWCLTQVTPIMDLYRAAIPEGDSLEVETCNSFTVKDSGGGGSLHRILWVDVAAEWSEEEIIDSEGKCVYKGDIGPEFASDCQELGTTTE